MRNFSGIVVLYSADCMPADMLPWSSKILILNSKIALVLETINC